ncbi:MAG: tyrosine-type recombinase/integrase [Streptosporangiaceae bacterium]
MPEDDDCEFLRQELMSGRRDLPRAGGVVAGPSALLPYRVVDAAGGEVEPVSRYLRDRVLGDVSPLTCRSYAHDLLRWFRLLWVLEVPWDQASEAETAVLAGWLRHAANPQRRRRRPGAPTAGAVNVVTGKPEPGPGYAPSAIAHTLTVVSGFYGFHLHFGRGPVVNPVPESSSRRKALAHRSPLLEAQPYRRARLRPRRVARVVRSIPDGLFDDLFACMRNDRDRALLAFYVSSGARASELLGLGVEDIDWAAKTIYVISKGSRCRQPVPASADAFVFLAGYLDKAGRPAAGSPVWRTLRGKPRPLSYWAMRQILERANEQLGTNWTLHDLRHTTAARLAADPDITLVEVQTIMRHAHLTTTGLYTPPRLDDLLDKLAAHYARPPVPPVWTPGYAPEDVRTVFGG